MCIYGYRYWTLGALHRLFGQFDIALNHYQKALATFRNTNDILNMGRMLNCIGGLHGSQGNVDCRKWFCMEAIRTVWQLQHEIAAIPALANVAMVYHHQDCHRLAIKLLKQVSERCQTMGDLLNEAITLIYMGQVYAASQQYLFAIACHQASLEILQNSLALKHREEAVCLTVLNLCYAARLYQVTHHSEAAEQNYRQAMYLLEKIELNEGSYLLLNRPSKGSRSA
ncbi:hypothetical protein Lepto7375DRAFT_6377 [Leptolyngbya sp. PCC 7375]|nr:hypothetical protein Lepto7375DRAFT_6377 [Leptolyngbya sp. PCC 7375]